MADTYTQLYTQLVFAVRNRQALIQPTFKDEVEKYMTGILQNRGHKIAGYLSDARPCSYFDRSKSDHFSIRNGQGFKKRNHNI